MLVLRSAAPVRDVAGGHDQLGRGQLDQCTEAGLDLGLVARPGVEVGDVEQTRHPPGQAIDSYAVSDAEIFDDLYLGLRAGGAMRKQRRGEPLTTEEEQALSRWQRLSRWRKVFAVGAFAVGTFGLGFTLGGLVFGRWRRAKA